MDNWGDRWKTYSFFNIKTFFKKEKWRISMWEWNIGQLLPVCPLPGTEPETQTWAFIGIQTSNLPVNGTMPSQLSHTGQGKKFILSCLSLYMDKGITCVNDWQGSFDIYNKIPLDLKKNVKVKSMHAS